MSIVAILLDTGLQDRIFKGIDFANSLSKELITLSIGILTITITFIRDIFKGNVHKYKFRISVAWTFFFLSIICGIWSMMALSGSLINIQEIPSIDSSIFISARLPAILQVLTFLTGILLVISYGIKGVYSIKENKEEIGNSKK